MASARALVALALLACIFFRPFLCFLAKHMFLRNLGPTPLRDSYCCDQGFLMPFLCHFQHWLCMMWFLDLAMSAPGPADALLTLFLLVGELARSERLRPTFLSGLWPPTHRHTVICRHWSGSAYLPGARNCSRRSSAYLLSLYSRYWVVELTQLSR